MAKLTFNVRWMTGIALLAMVTGGLSLVMGSNLNSLWHWPALAAVVLASLAVISLRKRLDGDADAAYAWAPAGASILFGGAGLAVALTNLEDPSKLGPCIAFAYLSIVYGSLMSLSGAVAAGTGEPRSADGDTQKRWPRGLWWGLNGAAAILATYLAVTLIGKQRAFLDPNAWMLSSVFTAAFILIALQATGGWLTSMRTLTAASADPADVRARLSVTTLIGQSAAIAGLIGSVIMQIHLLANLDDPQTIGPSLAASTVPMILGASLAVGTWVAAARLESRHGELSPPATSSLQRTLLHALLGFSLPLVGFAIIRTAIEKIG